MNTNQPLQTSGVVINAVGPGRHHATRRGMQSKGSLYKTYYANLTATEHDQSLFRGALCFEDMNHKIDNHVQVAEMCLNNILVTRDTPDAELEQMYKTIRPIGFSMADIPFIPDQPMATNDVAIHISGLKTVFNSGPFTIEAGDIVVWAFPNQNRTLPQAPKRLGYRSASTRILELIPIEQAAQNEISYAAFSSVDAVQEYKKHLGKQIMRIVGIAHESAKPNQFFALNVSPGLGASLFRNI